MVLVILIALWAMVLLPPYLKDRRASSRTFRSMNTSMWGGASGQRFLPLQHASTGYATSAVSSPTGMRAPAGRVGAMVAHGAGSNVVPLRPPSSDEATRYRTSSPGSPRTFETATAAGAHAEIGFGDDAPRDGAAMYQAWQPQRGGGLGTPTSTAAARERRRHVLVALTGLAFVTLLLALFSGGLLTALHVLVDATMLGYVILLVRHRQLEAERRFKIEPIRAPVSEQAPAYVQVAPSYLLQSGTGS